MKIFIGGFSAVLGIEDDSEKKILVLSLQTRCNDNESRQ